VEAAVRTRLVDGARVEIQVAGHRYSSTAISGTKLLGTVRLTPSISIHDAIVLVPHGRLTLGSFRGVGGGLRMRATF
jgi:hypothetical protein